MKRYISYLMNACLRKISLWILTAVYLFILVAFSIIVPLVANSPLLVPWTTDMNVTQLCLIILSAIFSAIMAVYIFREAQEDGTELLICSKPLERKKMIASKFICFGLLLVMFSILPVLILLFAYIVPQNSIMAVTWLIVGLICGNLVSMLVFGAVAALFSLAFTKVVVIVANVSLIIVLAIYSTVTIATAQSPLGKMLNSRKYAATQIVYFDNDNNAKGSSYILPTSTDIEEMLKVATIQGQKNIWQQYVDESHNTLINGFDIVNHLATVYFAGGLEQAWYNLNQGMGIGTSKNANYKITTTVNHEPQDQVSPEQTAIDIKPLIVNDDDPYWTNLYRKDSAKTWIDVSNVSRTQTYNFLDANKSQGEEIIRKLVQTVRYYIQLALTYSICSMTTSSIAAPADCRFFYDVSKQDAIDTYVVAGFYDGQNVIKNLKQQNWQNLEPTEDEIDFFNYALYKILFTNEYYADVNPNPDYAIWNDEIKTDTWEIQMLN